MKSFKTDNLYVNIFETRKEMGSSAADDIAIALKKVFSQKQEANVIFAAAPSQNDTLEALCKKTDIDWNRVNAFHMDEYIGLPKNSTALFAQYLKDHVFNILPFKSVNLLVDNGNTAEEMIANYKELLKNHKPDIVVLGIGENGHIAFNDPDVADFNDPEILKVVNLDEKCRNQQVHDGCFASSEQVPTQAITLTVPTLVSADYLFCSVPGTTKADAVHELVTTDKIDEHCPATAMRHHKNAHLYCDKDSAKELKL